MNSSVRSRACATAGAAALAVLTGTAPAPLHANGEITISMERGRVTLIATDARLGDVLAEWSRVGDTRFVGAERIGSEPITLHLIDAAEAEAIGLLLRTAAGYVAAPRRGGASGASRYDRVTILATRDTPPPARTGAAGTLGGGSPGAASLPAGNAQPRTPTEQPTLISMEELQRQLDAAAGNSVNRPRDSGTAAPDVPVVMTPFPGVGADPGRPSLPERWRRGRR